MFKKCLILFLGLFLLPTQVLAYTSTTDIKPVVERNLQIEQKAIEIKQMLQTLGEEARETPEFLDKVKDFLDLVVENKSGYVQVLKERAQANTVLSTEERTEILRYIENDLGFFTGKKEDIQTIENWQTAQQIGNDVKSYAKSIAPRIKGLAGLKLVDRAKTLVDRSHEIHLKLEESVESSNVNATDTIENDHETQVQPEKLETLKQNIDLADQKVEEAKDNMLQMVRLEDPLPNNAETMVKLKEARQLLKTARQNSLEITIDIIKAKMEK